VKNSLINSDPFMVKNIRQICFLTPNARLLVAPNARVLVAPNAG